MEWTPTKRFPSSTSNSTTNSNQESWDSWSEDPQKQQQRHPQNNNMIQVDQDENDDDDDDPAEDYDDLHELHPLQVTRKDNDFHNRCCNNSIWCVRDICGVICAIFTWFLVFYAEFVVMFVILLPSTHSYYRNINALIWNINALLALVSHSRAMFSDPGAVPRGNATKELINQMGFQQGAVIYKCQKCCSIKPARAHHCSICNRCIKRMDHHCPWINNCVGEKNQKYFVLFTLYIALISIHSLILSINQFMICIQRDWKECTAYTPPATVIFLIFLIFEALLFTIFTAVMFGTQLNAIWNDQTGIEQLKKEQIRWAKKSKLKALQSVFGNFSLSWLNPFTSPAAPSSHVSRAKSFSSYLSV